MDVSLLPLAPNPATGVACRLGRQVCWLAYRAPSSGPPWWPQAVFHARAGDAGEAVRSSCTSSASTGWIISFRISTVGDEGAAAAVAVAAEALVVGLHYYYQGRARRRGHSMSLCDTQRQWLHEQSKRH